MDSAKRIPALLDRASVVIQKLNRDIANNNRTPSISDGDSSVVKESDVDFFLICMNLKRTKNTLLGSMTNDRKI